MVRRARRQPPKRLNRRRSDREPKAKIIIVCEGKNTEPRYFYDLARYCGALVYIEEGAGVPTSILKRARELIQHPEDEFGGNDRVWAVFDCDEHPKVVQAINEAIATGISVGYSNPCFELWLVLHYKDHDAPIERRQIQRMLRTLMSKYDPRGSKDIEFGEIRDAVKAAEARAEAMDERRQSERNVRGNPSSTVYKLTREIRKRGR